MLAYERQLWAEGWGRLAGVDEAGRGPLAGPVVAAAVIFDPAYLIAQEKGDLLGLTDSKQLPALRRSSFFEILTNNPHVSTGLGIASVEEIDAVNILQATYLAMRRALANLPTGPDHILVDGRPVPKLPTKSTAIVGGDGKSMSIAAASVLAKVTRDRLMHELDAQYPHYGFARHKGYGSSFHIQALLEHGPSPVHRQTFRPVREAADLRKRSGELSG